MPLLSQLFTGDSAAWTDGLVPADATAATATFRGNTAGAGVVVEGVLTGGKWSFTLDAETTDSMVVGTWAVQFTATTPAGQVTYRPIGRIEIIQGLGFTGEPSPLDPRSDAERELAELRVAIRAIYRSASYKIASLSGQRELKRADLPWLQQREAVLLRRVANEKRAATGGGARRVLTVFDRS